MTPRPPGRGRLGALTGLLLAAAGLLAACASPAPPVDEASQRQVWDVVHEITDTSVLGPESQFEGSPYPDVGLRGLFPVRDPSGCEVAVLDNGGDSFAARMRALKAAKSSIRIQALIFKGDETGLRIAQVLKQKKAAGLDVRIIVDAFSNPMLQTQSMFFDLKQHGIEVEGYEAMALQWLNELPIPQLTPHADPDQPNKRFHEKMWIIDGGTDDAFAVVGGLNIGNEYFRANPENADEAWRDQDVAVRGAVIGDMVAAFDRNFEYFVDIKKSRGILNTNLYWDATRKVLDRTGKVPFSFNVDAGIVANVERLEARRPPLAFEPATCRFLQNRPRFKESYIQQAYLKLIGQARQEVLIANAYFVPTPSLVAALHDAARRCVAVRLISNSPTTNDLPEISLVGRGHYKALLAVNESDAVRACPRREAGIRIWEWTGQAKDEAVRSQGTMHSKFAVVDGRRSLVGSYNLDPRSERLNSETALVFLQNRLAQRLRRLFLDHDLKYSREVTPAMAAEFEAPQDVIQRFRQSIGQLFEAQL